MPLIKFTNKNKYGNLRHRIIYSPEDKPFSIKPKGFGPFVAVRRFKYTYEDPIMPPSLFTDVEGQKWIIPSWKKVLPETTLDDIEWVKPEIEKTEVINWEFKSSSSNAVYTVKNKGKNYYCNCPGYWRSFDKKCKHIKEVISKKN